MTTNQDPNPSTPLGRVVATDSLDPGAWTMTHAEVDETLRRGAEHGCTEALFCLGDKPEGAFAAYRRTLVSMENGVVVAFALTNLQERATLFVSPGEAVYEGMIVGENARANDLDVNTLRALEEALLNFAGCAVVISHDRWFLDRIATHMLAFEGESHVEWFEGNYQDYEKDRRRRLGAEADQPHRLKYRRLEA